VGGALAWLRRFRRFGFSFSWEFDRNSFVMGDSAAADAASLRDDTISRITLSGSFDSRDNFSDPRRGFFTLGTVDIFNEIKGNKADFFRFSWQGEHDGTFLERLTLSTSVRFARIQTIGSNVSVPTNELLYLGGEDTIRGFSEDSLGPVNAGGQAVGGRTRWVWNEELRVRLWRTLQWALFFDMGSLTNSFSQIAWSQNVRRSTGFGLRYVTPVGPLRLDYGIKLDRKTGESFGHVHFTFGYVF
jgi:outer membrane protein insertion porin family